MPLANTFVKVRVQARDGKILGPAATVKQPLLTVRNVVTGEILIDGKPFNTASSGTVVPVSQFSDKVLRNAIVVQPSETSSTAPGPYWLEPTEGQGELIVPLLLNEPSLLEFRATAYAPDPVDSSTTMWVLPGMRLLYDPGLVLTIAGLYATVTATASAGVISVTANVTMMCGCPITPQPAPPNTEPYWPSTEFNVAAEIRDSNGQLVTTLHLDCTSTSLFTGSTSVSPGEYEIRLIAVQITESNVGFARTKVSVQ